MIDYLNQNPGVWAFFAALFAGVAAASAIVSIVNSNKIREKEKAPYLTLVKDRFVYGQYEFLNLTNGVPSGVPGMTALLGRNEIIREIGQKKKRLNQVCMIYNTSRKHTATEIPQCYSRIFGEVHFKNNGGSAITSIEIIDCHMIMRSDTGHLLVDKIKLRTQGQVTVNVEKGQEFISYLCYLFDFDDHRLCDSKCLDENGNLKKDVMDLKRNDENQLFVNLPVIIDLYDQFIFTLKYTTRGNGIYTQKFIIKIDIDPQSNDDDIPSGMYNPIECNVIKIKHPAASYGV